MTLPLAACEAANNSVKPADAGSQGASGGDDSVVDGVPDDAVVPEPEMPGDAGCSPDCVVEPDAHAEPEMTFDPEPEIVVQHDASVEPDAALEPEVPAEPQPTPEPAAEPEPIAEPEPSAEPEPTTEPEPSTASVCGDGVMEQEEECDDGNAVSADGCEPDCTLTGALLSFAGELQGHTILTPCSLFTSTEVCTPESIEVSFADDPAVQGVPSHYEELTFGGDPSVTYEVTLTARGLVESKVYTDGTDADDSFALPADGLYIGGTPDNENNGHSVYRLRTENPPQDYFLNSLGLPEDDRDYRAVFDTEFTFTFQVVGGSTLIASATHPRNATTANCGMEQDNACFPTTLEGLHPLIADDVSQPYNGQFIGFVVEDVQALPPKEPVCGDGVLDEGEECDDGNLDTNDACEPDCTPSTNLMSLASELQGHTIVLPCEGFTSVEICFPKNIDMSVSDEPALQGVITHYHELTFGGDSSVTYNVTVTAHGVVESKVYTGGSDVDDSVDLPAHGLSLGGSPDHDSNSHAVFRLRTENPAQDYFLNSVGIVGDDRLHNGVFETQFTFTFPVVGGSILVLSAADPNNSVVGNCGMEQDNGCPPITAQNLDRRIADDASQPYDGQFIGFVVEDVQLAQ